MQTIKTSVRRTITLLSMNWAKQVAADSVNDRKDLHNKVEGLAGLIPRFQWWFIGILAAIILSNVLGPKFLSNDKGLVKETQSTITAIESKQANNQTEIEKIKKNTQLMMQKMGIRVEE